jgi:hypothetical protein
VQYDKVYCPNAAYLEKNTFFVQVHPVYEERHMEMTAAAILKVTAAYTK